jgi:very-long-chain (3R)-3-hydroxyacyl-CoA dehydratase
MAIGGIAKAYLILYNAFLTLSWICVLWLGVVKYSETNEWTKLWPTVEKPLKIAQTLAVLEIVHAIIRIVPSNVFLTFFQVFSRVFVLWGVLNLSPPSQVSVGVPLLLLAWSITEIIRYGYYVLHLVGLASIIQWFRYTLFIALYPIGVSGELLCIYASLEYVRQKQILAIRMPNQFNVAFDYHYALIGIMLSYIPIFPQLYLHMFAQRRKILGGGSKKSN